MKVSITFKNLAGLGFCLGHVGIADLNPGVELELFGSLQGDDLATGNDFLTRGPSSPNQRGQPGLTLSPYHRRPRTAPPRLSVTLNAMCANRYRAHGI